MKTKEFKSEKEELEFYRDMKRKTNDIIDEIHDLLNLDKNLPNRIWLMNCNRQSLIELKNAIKERLKSQLDEEKDE